jgi:hypothetical protein
VRSSATITLSWVAGLVLAGTLSAADQVLFDFEEHFDFSKVPAQDAKVAASKSASGSALRVATGHQQSWPGVTLPAPGGRWDLSAFGQVLLEVKNVGTNRVTVFCRVDNPGADGSKNCVTGSGGVNPGQTETLKVELRRNGDDRLGGKLFGMRGYPVGPGGQGGIDAAQVNQLVLFVSKPKQDYAFEVDNVRATGVYLRPTASVTDAEPYFPLIDTFGQYKHRDWPGKVHAQAELAANREQEARELAARPSPKGWDRYGGFRDGPQLEATGFFRTQKVNDKWWLVDPDGHVFFSHGIDCVRMFDATPIEERESWFEAFPGSKAEFQDFLSNGYALKGHYANRSPRCFSFFGANLLRKYGPDWRQVYPEVIHRRLRSWGLNTIANWSDEGTRLMRRTAYTDAVGSPRARMIEGSEGYWGKFPDVFDPGFAEGMRRSMAQKPGKSANDPWCIGYFSDNEMSWGDELALGLGALRSPPAQAAKQVFVDDLEARYGAIGKLNQAWGTAHASWDALRQSRETPDKTKARADLASFTTKLAEQYFRTVREAIKAVAPHQLYLGCRFAWVNDRAAAAAAKYCDVVSYNLYHRGVAEFQFNGGADVPLIIGEFHCGALDRGMFHPGLVSVPDQAARAQLYQDYVRGALRHPQFVGTHWFQWGDEPTTGRVYDEENYQIGFVDVADTPYRETIGACRAVAESLYETRLQKQ